MTQLLKNNLNICEFPEKVMVLLILDMLREVIPLQKRLLTELRKSLKLITKSICDTAHQFKLELSAYL